MMETVPQVTSGSGLRKFRPMDFCWTECTLYLVMHSCCTSISHLFSFCICISRMYLCDMLCLIPVCPNYYLFPIPLPSPPADILLVVTTFDVISQRVGMKGPNCKEGQ